MLDTVDITPSPRVLRALGQIPFAPWQCIAELLDNSLDGFRHAEANSIALKQKRIVVSWSTNASAGDRVLEIVDTGPGMTRERLNDCVRAGYSSNDPIENLGLFGMGFNIASARLGEKTTILSATPTSKEWVGIEIDFTELTKSRAFTAPLISRKKTKQGESETRILISKLDNGMANRLNAQHIRNRLEDVYTPILSETDVEVTVQGKLLSPRPHCVWGETRYVSRGGVNTPAILRVDERLGEALFDIIRNRYLSAEEEEAALKMKEAMGSLPEGVVVRQKHVRGWVGIQRFSDTDDFGIDYIRNGRKILIRDKTVFSYCNPITGRVKLEYPIELGSTVGGRIVGEVHIDHIPPTYQKNDFHRADPSWDEMIAVLRGEGPILPKDRGMLRYEDQNISPIARLITAYRRPDAGTKHLAVRNQTAKEWAKKHRSGEVEYQTDEKWWEAALEQDRCQADKGAGNAPTVDIGGVATDDVALYLDNVTETAKVVVSSSSRPQAPGLGLRDDLASRSIKSLQYTREYTYEGGTVGFNVSVWEVQSGIIGDSVPGQPCILLSESNICEFFYNPKHSFLKSFPVGFRELLLVYLAERFNVRDNLSDSDLALLFSNLMRSNFPDVKLDLATVQEKASVLIQRLRDRATELLKIREQEVIDVVHEASGDVEETVAAMVHDVELLKKFQTRAVGSIEALSYVPPKTLVRLVDRFPEEFFDGKFFKTPFEEIRLRDGNATDRIRQQTKERTVALLKDSLWIISDATSLFGHSVSKDDIARCEHSIASLNKGIVE